MHPLTGTPGHAIGRPWAAVKCQRKGDVIRLCEGPGAILVLKQDALVAPLPERFEVLGPEGPVLPSPGKHFVLTLETTDPFHLLAELE